MAKRAKPPTVASTSQASRAQWAWDRVSEVKVSDTEYLAEARRLPTRLLTSGLGQTMAYLYGKSKGDETQKAKLPGLFRHVAMRVRELNPGVSHRSVMELVVGLSADEYRRLGRELLETAGWIKRFAEGHIKKKPKLEDEQQRVRQEDSA